MKAYAQVSHIMLPKCERRRKEVRKWLLVTTVEEECCEPYGLEEMEQAISKMKVKSAAGPDGIAP